MALKGGCEIHTAISSVHTRAQAFHCWHEFGLQRAWHARRRALVVAPRRKAHKCSGAKRAQIGIIRVRRVGRGADGLRVSLPSLGRGVVGDRGILYKRGKTSDEMPRLIRQRGLRR